MFPRWIVLFDMTEESLYFNSRLKIKECKSCGGFFLALANSGCSFLFCCCLFLLKDVFKCKKHFLLQSWRSGLGGWIPQSVSLRGLDGRLSHQSTNPKSFKDLLALSPLSSFSRPLGSLVEGTFPIFWDNPSKVNKNKKTQFFFIFHKGSF